MDFFPQKKDIPFAILNWTNKWYDDVFLLFCLFLL
jgi:hypothetical protein